MEETEKRAVNVALALQLACCAASFIPGMPFPARLALIAAALWLAGFHMSVALGSSKVA